MEISVAHKRYLPKPEEFGACLAHLIEECGEAVSAAGKLARFGSFSFNPELPHGKREQNIDWLEREMADVENAIVTMRRAMVIARQKEETRQRGERARRLEKEKAVENDDEAFEAWLDQCKVVAFDMKHIGQAGPPGAGQLSFIAHVQTPDGRPPVRIERKGEHTLSVAPGDNTRGINGLRFEIDEWESLVQRTLYKIFAETKEQAT